MSHLMMIAIPGGRTATGDGLLRVLMVPVLDGGGTLAAHGMATWPPPGLAADDARLVVEVAPAPTPTPAASAALRPAVDAVPGLWQRFFGSIDVRPPGPAVERTMDVQPTTEQADAIVGAYRDVARQLTDEDVAPAFGAMSRSRAAILAGLATQPVPQEGTGTPSGRAIDFHLATSVLREHPSVLRALGLIVEVTVPTTAFLGSALGTAVLRVTWPTVPDGIPVVQPRWTRFVRNRFLPAPGAGSDVHPAGGMVALGRRTGTRPVWRVHTVDVDHALRGLAAVAAPESDGRLPALRTAGVLLARVGRDGELAERVARNGRSPDDELLAEHLTLGYRVDARILGGDWHSLCRRRSRYLVNGVEFVAGLLEEGHVKVGGGIDRGDNVLHADEVVARWDGWSLAVPRPALRQRPPGATTPATELPFQLDTSGIEVEPGSLLRLRFGEDYQVRARVADAAGGGPELTEASLDQCDSEVVRFRRHEPVLPPDARVPDGATAFGPGVSPTALVIRTAEGESDAVADTTRDLVPPSATFEVIERHGRLDGDPDVTLGLLARKDLADPAVGGVVAFVRGEPGEPPRDLEPQDWTSSRPGPPPADPWPDLRPKQLVLRARNGDEPTLQWETDELLVVRLAPAEEATVEVSSLIDQAAKQAFSISDWLTADEDTDDGVAAAEDLLASGRHPMATPARRITVRHAVRAPKGRPQGQPAVSRVEGSTSGLIHAPDDSDAPLVGVDPPSTLAVDVMASWTPVDDTTDPPATRRPVGRIDVGRADTQIRPLQHEFGDTKHRNVTYTWAALSRFRDCFPPGSDAAAFRTEGTIGPVSVPSSARPVAPVVRSVTPAFLWQEERSGNTIVRRRLGNRVRVELAASWFTTGDGERLAVIAADDPEPAVEVVAVATHAGRDPLWDTDAQEFLPTPLGDVELINLPEAGTVRIVPHGVFEAAGSHFADVTFPATPSYGALVQLGVARFQPESLPGLALSPAVRTDFVPLLPDRTLTISVVDNIELRVRLDGIVPRGPRTNRVDVVIEIPVAPDEIDEELPLTVGEDGLWLFFDDESGPVGSDIRHFPSSGRLRVRVREVEFLGRDTSPSSFGSAAELDERVVFTDTVELDF